MPTPDTVDRWRRQTPERFRFSFKFPREITHDAQLRGALRASSAFLARLSPLGPRLGPFMIQLPAVWPPSELDALARLLAGLPRDFRYAVEVRHPGFFSRSGARDLQDVLVAAGSERIVMDTRPMRAGDPEDPDVLGAAHAKPDVPVRALACGRAPIVRLVAHPVASVNAPWFLFWAARMARWVRQGRRPTLFMHCPNNDHSPGLARDFDRVLRARLPRSVAALAGPRSSSTWCARTRR